MKTTIITMAGIFTLSTGCLGSCFVAGTRVWTKKGLRPIESIQVGDPVWSWNVDDNAPVLRAVTKLIRSESFRTHRLRAGEFEIRGVTGEHPFWNPSTREWVQAKQVMVGDAVMCWPGADEARCLHVQERTLDESVTAVPVYTLSVSGVEENFIAEGFLVHNKSISSGRFETGFVSSSGPCVEISGLEQEVLHSFGEVALGEEIRLDVNFKGRSDCRMPEEGEQLVINEDDPDNAFGVIGDVSGVTYATLLKQPHMMTVVFQPPNEGDFEAQLRIGFPSTMEEEVQSDLLVQLFGTGVSDTDSK